MAENIRLSDIIPASPERVFTAWLDAKEHASMTGAGATDEGEGRFTAWDGYISARTVSSVPHSKIVQAWRTTEFPEKTPDSTLTLHLEPVPEGTKLTLVHTRIPDGQGESYEQGWRDHYFAPMKKHFDSPLEQVREVSERISQAVEDLKDEAMEAVDEARGQARKQAVKAVQAVKKAQKQASHQLQVVGQKMKALVTRKKKPAAKKPAPKKAAARRPAPKKKAAPPKKASAAAKKSKKR